MAQEINTVRTGRLGNFDFLRILSMFLVVTVHTSLSLNATYINDATSFLPNVLLIKSSSQLTIICDALFFLLSGYFGMREVKIYQLKQYYLKKFYTIILPLFIYSILTYLLREIYTGSCEISILKYSEYVLNLLTHDYWFIPTLMPLLIFAPVLYKMFENINAKYIKLFVVIYVFYVILGFFNDVNSFMVNSLPLQMFTPLCNVLGGNIFSVPTLSFIMGFILRKHILSNETLRKYIKLRFLISLAIGYVMLILIHTYLKNKPIHPFSFDAAENRYLLFGVLVFIIFNYLKIKESRLLKFIAERMLSIYFTQFVVIELLQPYFVVSPENTHLYMFFLNWIVTSIVVFIISLISSILIDYIIVKNVMRFLQGIQSIIQHIYAKFYANKA